MYNDIVHKILSVGDKSRFVGMKIKLKIKIQFSSLAPIG